MNSVLSSTLRRNAQRILGSRCIQIQKMTRLQRRYLSSSSSGVQVQKSTDTPIIGNLPPIVDFRSDTVTAPPKEMLDCVQHAIGGDDVMGEDPTVLEL